MFTGIIEHVGRVRGVRPVAGGARVEIDLGPLADGAKRGDSVSVDGACLTIAKVSGAVAAFDAGGETLGRTTLGALAAGARVNLERALQVGDRLGGHIVQGHVDGVGRIRHAGLRHAQWELVVTPPANVAELLVEKGSVAAAGISLTIAAVEADGTFTCAIIHTTVEETNLTDRRTGDGVNLEADIIGRYVRRFLAAEPAASAAPLSLDTLKEHGFA